MNCRTPLSIFALAAVVTAVTPVTTAARHPPDCVGRALLVLDSARSRADSIALVERFVTAPPAGDVRCGRLLAGYLIGMTSTPAEDEWQRRLRGMEFLDGAFRDFSDEPRLYLARGMLLYHRQARTDALRMFDRAVDHKDDGTPLRAKELMLVYYTRGLIRQDFWRDWRSYGQLKSTATGQWSCGNAERPEGDNFTSSSTDHLWLVRLNQICPDRFAENMTTYFDRRDDMRQSEFEAMEAAFRYALAVDSTTLLPGEALLGEYVYLAMWERAKALVRSLRHRCPEHYKPLLFQGLVLHATGQDSLASRAFARAFGRMPDSLANRYHDIAGLLSPEQASWFAAADSTTRLAAVTAYWTSLDPLYLTPVNERKLEHYARIVAADLMFTSPALEERGSASFAGGMWIRYGRPRHLWELSIPAGRVAFWDYGPGPDLSFIRGTAYRSFRPTDQVLQVAEALARVSPQTYRPSTILDSVYRLEYQIVRVLDRDHQPGFLVFAEWPETVEEGGAALVLFDQRFLPVAQWRGGRPPDRAGLYASLRAVPAGHYSLTVEVFDRARRTLGRVRDTLSTLAPGDSGLMVSDLLLASAVRPRRGDDAVSREELEITPLYRPVIGSRQSLVLYWEVYGRAEEGDDGRVSYEVSIEVQDASRRPMLARVLRGVGIGGEREPATRISYRSQRPMLDGRAVEWLELSSTLETGEYVVVLTVTDPEHGVEITRERAVTVPRNP